MRLNIVSYSEMGSSWPSQNIHPAGAKFPANILISPTYGWPMDLSSSLRREDALQGDAAAQRQEGLHVEMRLAAADGGQLPGKEGCQVALHGVVQLGRRRAQQVVGARIDQIGIGRRGLGRVDVGGDLGDGQRVRLLAAPLSKGVARPNVNRRPAAQVRQTEVRPAVAAVGGAQQREQRL